MIARSILSVAASSPQTQTALCLQGLISMLTFTSNELYFPDWTSESDAANALLKSEHGINSGPQCCLYSLKLPPNPNATMI